MELAGPTPTKVCTKCKEEKPVTEFHNDRSSRDRLSSWCKDCKNKNRSTTQRAKTRGRGVVRTRNLYDYIKSRGGACEHCGWTGHPGVLEFHHLDHRTKIHGLSASYWANKKLESTKAEAEKCIMLCPTCHRGEHLLWKHGVTVVGSIVDTDGNPLELIKDNRRKPWLSQ